MYLSWTHGGTPLLKIKQLDWLTELGKRKRSLFIKLIIQGSVEEKIFQLQDEKRQLFDELLGEGKDDEFFSGKLSMKDFEFILDSDLE